MTFSEVVERVAEQLEAAGLCYGQGFENAEDEALRIAYAGAGAGFSGDKDNHLILADRLLDDKAWSNIKEIVRQRTAERRPLAYILGEAWFCGQRFYIDERVIIPRSYCAEWIPQQFRPWVNPGQIKTVLDLCCGSGCIAICCALAFPDAVIRASDISSDALDVASRNIKNYGLQGRVRLNQGHLFEGIRERFDLIVCNPPYVDSERLANLPAEYRQEPGIAFRAGVDGLDFVLEVLIQSEQYLTPNGIMIVESGSVSGKLMELLGDVPFVWLSTEYDEQALFLLEANQLKPVRNKIIESLDPERSENAGHEQ